MSRRRQRPTPNAPERECEARASAAIRQPSVLTPFSLLLPGALALVFAALGGGMLNDKVTPLPGVVGPLRLLAVPAAFLLIALSLPAAFWRTDGGDLRTGTASACLHGAAFCLFIAWAALSLLRSDYLYPGVVLLAILAAALALGAVIARTASIPRVGFGWILAVAGTGLLVSAIGINEYVANWREGNSLWRVFGGFVNPNSLAGYLLLTIPITGALFLSTADRSLTMLSGTALLLQTLCLLLTQSRLGLLSLCLSLIGFAVLLVWSGSLKGPTRRRGIAVAALILVLLVAGGRPLLKRLVGAGEEAHSGRFRVYTWCDTLRMAQANSLLGTGIGSFETTYPRYARLQYTAHAHNSYLQIAGETGFPGLIFLLTGLGATLAVGMKSLGRWRRTATPAATQEAPGVRSSGGRKESEPLTPNAPSPPLLCGLLASLAGSALHNLFESDLYIPAIALLLGTVCGLVLALSASPPVERPNGRRSSSSPLSAPAARLFTGAAALLMAVYALRIAGGRWEANAAEAAVREGSGATALQRYESAITLDPWNVEYRLSRASLYEASGQQERTAAEYRDALKVASIGKVCYRFGKFYARQGKKEEAVRMFERARTLEPHNMQNLLALADAYRAAGRPADAEAVYQKMIGLYRSPFGAVRALTELVDWEFGVAYLGLAEGALERGERVRAVEYLREGAGILGEFWRQRNLQAAAIRVRPDVRRSTALRYDWALEQWEKTLRALNRPTEAAEIRTRRAAFRAEMEKEFETLPSGAS